MKTIDLNSYLNRTRLAGQAPQVVLANVRLEDGPRVPFARAVVNVDTGQPISIVGPDYELVPHNHILETVETAITRLGLTDTETPRGIYFTKRGAKMRALFKFPTIQRHVVSDDALCPVVRIVNSYDTSTRITIEVGAFRFVCTNFAIGGGGIFSAGFNAIHQGEIDIQKVQEQLEYFLNHFDQIIETFRRWRDTPWHPEDAQTLSGYLANFGNRNLNRIGALTAPEKIENRFRAYNEFTFAATHGMRTANAAFNFLDATNAGFIRLDTGV